MQARADHKRRQADRSHFYGALALAAVAGLAATKSTYAADRLKADNAANLDQPVSWAGESTPGASDVAVWDSTVTSANIVLLGSDLSFGGLRVNDPGGPVTIDAGNTLTLGALGLDASAATQDLTINSGLTLLTNVHQKWTVAAGRNITVTPIVTVGARATANFDITSGGLITLNGNVASSRLNHAVVNNGADWAGLNASKQVVRYDTVGTYTANTAFVGGFVSNWDVVNHFASNAGNAYAVSSNRTLDGVRFNTPTPDGSDWTVNITALHSLSGPGILVTPNVNTNVIYNGTSSVRLTNTGYVRNYAPGKDLVFNAAINESGAQALVKGGPSRVIVNGNTFYTGGTFIEEGTIQFGNGGTTGATPATGGITVNNGATLSFSRSNATLAVANVISGAGTVAVNNTPTGVVILSGVNTYTGPTNLNGGLVQASSLSNLGDGSQINLDGGGLQFGSAFDASSRTVTIQAGGATINTNGNNVVFANPIGNGGSGSLTKTGSGTLTLTGAQTYTGGTIVSGGTLSGSANVGALTVNAGGDVAPGVGVGTIVTSALTLENGAGLTFEFGAGNDQITSSGALTLNGGALTLYQATTTNPFSAAGTYDLLTYSGTLGGMGISALSVANEQPGFAYTFSDTGSVIRLNIETTGIVGQWLNAAGGSWNTAGNWSSNPSIPNGAGHVGNFTTALSGDVTVTLDGNKTIGGAAFNSASGNYTIAQGSGGSLTIDNSGSDAQFSNLTGNHTISAPVVLNSNLNVEPTAGSSLTISGAISGAGAITNSQAGTLVLGNSSNTYSGGTSVTAGTVEFNGLGALGSGNVTLNGGSLRYASGNTSDVSARLNPLGASGGTVDTNGNNVSFATPISGSGGFGKSGTGTLTLTLDNTYTGPTTVSGGILSISGNGQLGDPGTGASVNLSNGGTLAVTTNLALDNGGVNPRAVTVGTGGGAVDVPEEMALTLPGPITGNTLSKLGTGTLNVSDVINSAPFVVSAGTLHALGTTSFTNGGFGTGAITLQGGATISGAMPSGSTLSFPNTLTVPTGQTGTVNGTSRFNWTGAVSGGGTLNVNVNTGEARHDFNNNWSGFTGSLNIDGSGTAQLMIQGGAGTFNNGWSNAAVNLGGSVAIVARTNSGGNTIDIGSLSGNSATASLGGTINNAGSPRYSIGALGTNSTFAGQVIGNASLIKAGTGTTTLTGTLGYTGTTTVNAGTLKLETNLVSTSNIAVTAGTLELASGGGSNRVLVTPSVSVAGDGRIDIRDNKLITATPAGTATGGVYEAGSVQRMVQTAYQESSWSGPGLTTSMEDATTGLTSIAIATGEQIGRSDFAGQPVGPTDTIAFYTYGGDTNFDGKLDADDYGTIDFNVLLPGPIDGYYNGDFNYDGVVNADDYGVIDFNILAQNDPFPTSSAAVASSSAGLAGVTAVPEPASMSIVGLGGAALFGRRRRRV